MRAEVWDPGGKSRAVGMVFCTAEFRASPPSPSQIWSLHGTRANVFGIVRNETVNKIRVLTDFRPNQPQKRIDTITRIS